MSLSAKTNIAYQQVESPLLMANRVMIDNAGDISFVNDEGEATTINGTSIDTLHINTESASIKNLAVENFEVSNENITGSVVILTESWNDGNGEWYRKYSDGWIEQGGFLDDGGSSKVKTQNLHCPFSNNKYTLIISKRDTRYGGNGQSWEGVNSTTSTNFEYRLNFTTQAYWYACGY